MLRNISRIILSFISAIIYVSIIFILITGNNELIYEITSYLYLTITAGLIIILSSILFKKLTLYSALIKISLYIVMLLTLVLQKGISSIFIGLFFDIRSGWLGIYPTILLVSFLLDINSYVDYRLTFKKTI